MEGILYLLISGCQWGRLPSCYPKWEIMYYYSQMRGDETFANMNDKLRDCAPGQRLKCSMQCYNCG
jgi:transposase